MTRLSLYELIKKTYQEKGRPLKIVCDWDDCIQPGESWIIFQASPDKNDLSKFDDYFQAYFNESTATNKEAIEFTKKIKKEKSAGSYYDKFVDKYGCNWKYEVTPFTTIAEDLLKCLKEELIDELLVISSFAYWYEGGARPSSAPRVLRMLKSKTKKILETFGQFDQCNLEHTEVSRDKEKGLLPKRFERIKMLLPDFDIFIDDRGKQIAETAKYFSSDKIYVLPAYDNTKDIQGSQFYRVKTTISDLKNEDFAQAAQEYQQKHSELASRQAQQNQETKEESIWKQPYLYLAFASGIGICLLGIGIYWMLKKVKNNN